MSAQVVSTSIVQGYPYNNGNLASYRETAKRKEPAVETEGSKQESALGPLKRRKVESVSTPTPQEEQIALRAFERFNDLKNAASLVLMKDAEEVLVFKGTDLAKCPQYLKNEINLFGIDINADMDEYSTELRNRKWLRIRPPAENASQWHKEDFKIACIDLAMERFDAKTHF